MTGNEGRPDSEYSAPLSVTDRFEIVRLQIPVLETGNGSALVQAPTLCRTVGGKPRSGGTSMDGRGVLPVTTTCRSGVSGSSVWMIRVQDLGPSEVGVKRMTRSMQKSGLTVAGNQRLMSVKSGHAGLKKAFVTCRSHAPTLHTEIRFSASVPAQTSPKSEEPVIRTSPAGALPLTDTILTGEAGSLLLTAIDADLAPRLAGWNRIGT